MARVIVMLHKFFPAIVVSVLILSPSDRAFSNEDNQFKTAFTLFAFSELRAMPTFYNKDLTLGDTIRISDQYKIIDGEECFYDIIPESSNIGDFRFFYKQEIEFSTELSGKKRRIAEISASVGARFEQKTDLIIKSLTETQPKRGVLAFFNRTRNIGCGPVYELMDKSENVSDIVIEQYFEGSLETKVYISFGSEATATLSADELLAEFADLGAAGSYREGSEYVAEFKSPTGVIAVRSYNINRKEIARLFALLANDPYTVAELEFWVDQYISGDSADLVEKALYNISWAWEKLGLKSNSIADFKAQLFSAEPRIKGEMRRQLISALEWRSIGLLAAARQSLEKN